MNAQDIIDTGGKLEQVLFKLHKAAHGDEPVSYGKLYKSAEQLTALPMESLQALIDTERAFYSCKQRENMASAKRRGASFGRPENAAPKNYAAVMQQFLRGELSGLKAAAALGMPYSTFIYRARKEKKAKVVKA